MGQLKSVPKKYNRLQLNQEEEEQTNAKMKTNNNKQMKPKTLFLL